MYVEHVSNRNSKPTILLRESYRENDKVRKRTLANLSKWPTQKVQAFDRVLHGESYILGSNASKVEIQAAINKRFQLLEPYLNERLRRLFAAAEAVAIGHGGIAIVERATGVSRRAIRLGIKELKDCQSSDETIANDHIRKPGGGHKKRVDEDPQLKDDLEKLIEPTTRGEPESPLRWTCKSVRRLAKELCSMGHKTSHRMVAELLHELGYSLQANRKTKEGTSHPDRNAQFEYINAKVEEFFESDDPVISVDTKKKELVGNFKNGGRELRPKGDPELVEVYDFPVPKSGKVIPYGVYDLHTNTAWVSVGIDHDTAAFAIQTIRRWWMMMGKDAHPTASRLFITADGGGSNGSRVKLWKIELQKLVNEFKIPISVSHFPPGTSKWNKIEHRLFSFITQNWRGKPLISHEVIVNLIAATTTETGLYVKADLDTGHYPKGIKISQKDMDAINIERDDFHGEWNYTIYPSTLV